MKVVNTTYEQLTDNQEECRFINTLSQTVHQQEFWSEVARYQQLPLEWENNRQYQKQSHGVACQPKTFN